MRTHAIIFHTQPWREHDLLVRFYSQEAGLISAIAKGALREGSVQGMHLSQGSLVRFELVPGKGMPLITGAFAVNAYSNIRGSLPQQAAMWVLFESVRALVSAPERDERLWHALEDFVRELNACNETNTLMVLRNTQRDILSILGYAPHTTICGVCGATPKGESTSFSVELGSIVCTSCTRSGWHGTVLVDDDRRWLASERASAPCTTRAVRAPTEQLMEFISGRRLRSLDLLFEAVQT